MCRYDVAVVSSSGGMKTVSLYSKQLPVQQPTVGQLRKEALKAFSTEKYLGEIRLVVEGKPLDDDSASLSDCKIKPNSVVQMVTKVHGG
ncbi:unnamed protein product [Oreochromis niloticus]|nr:unnamed protein product [Mustela putorius furo]